MAGLKTVEFRGSGREPPDGVPVARAAGGQVAEQAGHSQAEGGLETAAAGKDFHQGVGLIDDSGDVIGAPSQAAEFEGKWQRFEEAAGQKIRAPVGGSVKGSTIEGQLSRQAVGGDDSNLALALAVLEHRTPHGHNLRAGECAAGHHDGGNADHLGDRFEAVAFVAEGLPGEFGGIEIGNWHGMVQVVPFERLGGQLGSVHGGLGMGKITLSVSPGVGYSAMVRD